MRKILPLLILILTLSSCTAKEPISVLSPGVDTVSQFSTYTPNTCMLETKDVNYQMKIASNDVDTNAVGTYTVLYTYTFEETEYTCQRKVFIVDETAPEVILVKGIDTVVKNSKWIDMSVEYSDTNDSALDLSVDNTVDITTTGTYVVTYTVTDEDGNEGFAYRYVNVVE